MKSTLHRICHSVPNSDWCMDVRTPLLPHKNGTTPTSGARHLLASCNNHNTLDRILTWDTCGEVFIRPGRPFAKTVGWRRPLASRSCSVLHASRRVRFLLCRLYNFLKWPADRAILISSGTSFQLSTVLTERPLKNKQALFYIYFLRVHGLFNRNDASQGKWLFVIAFIPRYVYIWLMTRGKLTQLNKSIVCPS